MTPFDFVVEIESKWIRSPGRATFEQRQRARTTKFQLTHFWVIIIYILYILIVRFPLRCDLKKLITK